MTREEEIEALAAIIHGWEVIPIFPNKWCTWEEAEDRSRYHTRARRYLESLYRFKETGRHFYPVVISREDLKHGC